MSKFNHPFLNDKYLTRPPGNYCCFCGYKVQVHAMGRNYFLVSWKSKVNEQSLIGYCHRICPTTPPSEDSDKKVRPR